MPEYNDINIVDRTIEIDGPYQHITNETDIGTLESQPYHPGRCAKHQAAYDSACDQCRIAAENEYRDKLARGEMNMIEFKD